MNILYVEDEENDVILMRKAFTRSGWPPEAVQVAADGQEALRILREASKLPDLILLDLNLPGLSGFEVLERLRSDARSARIPVAIFSSSGRVEDRRRGRDLGADHYILKPTSGSEFAQSARELMEICRSLAAKS